MSTLCSLFAHSFIAPTEVPAHALAVVHDGRFHVIDTDTKRVWAHDARAGRWRRADRVPEKDAALCLPAAEVAIGPGCAVSASHAGGLVPDAAAAAPPFPTLLAQAAIAQAQAANGAADGAARKGAALALGALPAALAGRAAGAAREFQVPFWRGARVAGCACRRRPTWSGAISALGIAGAPRPARRGGDEGGRGAPAAGEPAPGALPRLRRVAAARRLARAPRKPRPLPWLVVRQRTCS
jgi:hypothetical protein